MFLEIMFLSLKESLPVIYYIPIIPIPIPTIFFLIFIRISNVVTFVQVPILFRLDKLLHNSLFSLIADVF